MVVIRDATVADVAQIQKARSEAFNSPISRWLGSPSEAVKTAQAVHLSTSILVGDARRHVACDDSGKVMGMIHYNLKRDFEPTESGTWLSRLEGKLYGLERTVLHFPVLFAARAERAERRRKFAVLDNAFANRQKEILEDICRDYVCVETLCVDPATQGCGVGVKLLQCALDVANQNKIPCYLESSAKGFYFYLKRGFKDMEQGTEIKDGEIHIDTLASVIWHAP